MPLSRVIVDCVQNRPSHRPPDFSTVIPRLELAMTVIKSDQFLSGSGKNYASFVPESKDDSRDDSL